MVHPIPSDKKIELPSVTKKKIDHWKDVDEIYSSAYGLLSYAVGFVKQIVEKNYIQLEHVDPVKLTNMVSNLDQDVNEKRTELNGIYAEITANKNNSTLSDEDLFMMRLQLTASIQQWMETYQNIIGKNIEDISDYISKGKSVSIDLPLQK